MVNHRRHGRQEPGAASWCCGATRSVWAAWGGGCAKQGLGHRGHAEDSSRVTRELSVLPRW